MSDNRAIEYWQKEEVVRRILNVWKSKPELRLGQLLSNAAGGETGEDLFCKEDFELADDCDRYLKRG